MIRNIDFDDLVILDQVFMFQMCFIHLFVASSCHRGGDEAIIGRGELAPLIILQNCLLVHQRMITEYRILPKDMKMSQREIKGVLFAGKSWNFSFVCSIF